MENRAGWTRRDVLKLALASCALSTGIDRRALGSPAIRGPRYILSVILGGGMDAIYTTDPKVRSDVDTWVDIPYSPDAIVSAAGIRLGPHFAPLAQKAGDLAIINNVLVQTANHLTGSAQFLRFKTNPHRQMPSLLEIIGSRREGQPLACMTIGSVADRNYSSGFFPVPHGDAGFIAGSSKGPLDFAEEATPEDLQQLASILRRQASQLRSSSSATSRQTADNIEQTATLFDRLPTMKPFKTEIWSANPGQQVVAENLQRALWAFENDVTRCIFYQVGAIPWDSHTYNAQVQSLRSGNFVPMLARFLDELERRTRQGRSLRSDTLVVLGSELGRFPRINNDHGKDHFPEVPLVFIGAGVNKGVFGGTGKHMQALPVARNGAVAAAGQPILLDDVGTTLLHLVGVRDPGVYGYTGRVLEFLV